MRLHRLTITAFGPFAGTEEIDFDALSEAGLFLVNGPTGAGKSSVLDAVCFALYGAVPGAREAAKKLHSDHAPRDREPEVVLEFTARGRRLRITRSPQWEAPKRGGGTTTRNAKVVLQELAGGRWEGRSTRIDETAHFVRGLLGMDRTQFCQVALLPQGEFAGFLRAEAKVRADLLEKLFDTRVFTDVERWLAERRKETQRLADERERAVLAVADRIAEAAGAERDDTPAEALPGWAAGLAEAARAQHAAAEERAAAAEKVHLAARQTFESARELADRQRRHADALARRAALQAREPERRRARDLLDAAARADRVLPLLRGADERAEIAAQAAARAGECREAVRRTVPAFPDPDAGDAELAEAARARHAEIAALEGLAGDARRLRAIEAEVEELDAEIARLDEDEAAISATLLALPGRRDTLTEAREAARARAAGRPAAEAAVEAARSRLDAARRRDTLAGDLAAAEAAHRAAVDEAQACRDRLQEIRQARLDGMAAELAGRLVPGRPCQVCGSSTHPAPAAPLGAAVDEQAEQAAADADEAAQAAREEAARRLERLRAELAAATELAGDDPAEALAGALAAAEAELAALAEVEAGCARIEAELRTVEADLRTAVDRRGGVIEALAAARSRSDALAAEAGGIRRRLDAAIRPDPTLEARMTRLSAEACALDAAAEAVRAERIAVAELESAREKALAAATAEGFADADEARAGVLTGAARDEPARLLRALDDEEAAVRSLLADPELAVAAGESPPDLPALAERRDAAEQAHTAAVAARERARDRADRLAELSADLDRALRAWRPAAETARLTAGLANLAAGTSADNRLRMRLSAYVLAARLEQVVAAANERLDRMSGGRYALRHSTDKEAGDRTRSGGGLGLRVLDAWTGQQRDPATLSGGETFVTSLALALGLADVVTAEAGGVEIGTLFVDEGFGTLDEDTLDEVMDVLDGLRDGGRAVGIVSHVAELRTRIPAQLQVRKTRAGSAVTLTGV